MALKAEEVKRINDSVTTLRTIIETNFNVDVDITQSMLSELDTITGITNPEIDDKES